MSQLIQVREQLLREWQRLKHQWDLTSSQWRDEVRYRFEKEFWQEYEPTINSYIKELDNLNRIIDQARHEVK